MYFNAYFIFESGLNLVVQIFKRSMSTMDATHSIFVLCKQQCGKEEVPMEEHWEKKATQEHNILIILMQMSNNFH